MSIEGDVLFKRQKLGMTENGAQTAYFLSDVSEIIKYMQSIGLIDAMF